MLSRRQIRIKVMQNVYAFQQNESHELSKGENDLFASIDRIYDSYLYLLQLIIELADMTRLSINDAEQKHFLDPDGLDTNPKFLENKVVNQLTTNADFVNKVKRRSISWQKNHDLVRKIFLIFKKSPEYKDYILSTENTFKEDQEFVLWLIKNIINPNEVLQHHLEEINIFWVDDKRFVEDMVKKTIKLFKENGEVTNVIVRLYNDPEEDPDFARYLFRKTIIDTKRLDGMIEEFSKNWELNRIAMMDIILMKLAITEILTFPSIPTKVSIDEYIDISKEYSTPDSKVFINGILDKIVKKLKDEGQVKKTGRGLIE